jgi:hypothetical protein
MSSLPSESARKQAISEAWLRARRTSLPSLIDLVRTDLPFTWIKATDLFNESTLPVGLSTTSFSKALFQHPYLDTLGSDIYFGGSDIDFVHRHPIRNSFHLCSCFLWHGGGLDPAIKEDIFRVLKESNRPDAVQVEQIRSRLASKKSVIVTPGCGGRTQVHKVDLQESAQPIKQITKLDLTNAEQQRY